MGIDPSEKMLEIAEDRGIITLKGTAETLPFDNDDFELVTTICFVEDLKLVFKEAKRVLIPGGSLLIGFVDRNSLIGKMYFTNTQSSIVQKR